MREKSPKYGVISGPNFPVFGLNTKIYGVNIRIQSEYRKIQTRNNSVFGHFSHSESLLKKNRRKCVSCSPSLRSETLVTGSKCNRD